MKTWQRVFSKIDGLTRCFLLVLILNAPELLTAYLFYNTLRPNISIDILLYCILLFGKKGESRIIHTVPLVALFIFDIWLFLPPGVTTSNVFNEGINSLDSIGNPFLYFAGAIGVLYAAFWGFARRPSPGREFHILFFSIAPLLFLIWLHSGANYIRSAVYFSIKDPAFFINKMKAEFTSLPGEPEQNRVNDLIKQSATQKTILIVTESLGILKEQSDEFMRNELSQLRSKRSCRHSATYEEISTKKFTITSEIFYLCGLTTRGFSIEIGDHHCAPKSLQQKSFAYHNNGLKFYSRDVFYRDAGFDMRYGKQEMDLPDDSENPFDAPTDERVAQFLLKNAEKTPGFHYWLTIDLHSPYVRSSKKGLSPLDTYTAIRRENIGTFSNIIGKLHDYDFIITGDHNPKFFSSLNEKFKERTAPLYKISACKP